jgi:predicted dehydrogenase
VALADPDSDRLAEVGGEHGVANRYASAEAMFDRESLDIVSIATPNCLHKPLTIAAFASGCHVFCEKPMAMNAEEAREMIAAGQVAERRLMINFSYRFTPQAWALKRAVDEGLLGDVYFGRTSWLRRSGMPKFGGWFGIKAQSGGGPLIDLGVHRLDLALWLMGYPEPEWIMASTYDHLARERAAREGKAFDVEDLAVGLVRFKTGATLEIEASWAGHIKERELMETRILGTTGGLVHRNTDGSYAFEAEMYFDRYGEQCSITLSEPPGGAPSPMHHFADCILDGKRHMARGEEGLIVMQLLDGIYESASRGEPVRVSD